MLTFIRFCCGQEPGHDPHHSSHWIEILFIRPLQEKEKKIFLCKQVFFPYTAEFLSAAWKKSY